MNRFVNGHCQLIFNYINLLSAEVDCRGHDDFAKLAHLLVSLKLSRPSQYCNSVIAWKLHGPQ